MQKQYKSKKHAATIACWDDTKRVFDRAKPKGASADAFLRMLLRLPKAGRR